MNGSGMDTAYNCFIAAGFAVPLLDLIVGGIGGAWDFGLDFDFDLDLDAELPLLCPVPINIMVLSFAAILFGTSGRLCSGRVPIWLGVLISLMAALAGGYLIARFLVLPLRRNRTPISKIEDMTGREGTVKLEIRQDFVGTIVLLNASGSMVTYDARPERGYDKILIGTEIEVTEVDAEKRICTVRPLRRDKEEEIWNH